MKMLKNIVSFIFLLILSIGVAFAAKPIKDEGIRLFTISVEKSGKTTVLNGTLYGLTRQPSGDYKIKVKNCAGFKQPTFSIMNCTVIKRLDTLLDVVSANDTIITQTTFYQHGEYHSKVGYVAGCHVYPIDGYTIKVNNGKNVKYWNSLECTIK